MLVIDRILRRGGWRKSLAFTKEDMIKISQSLTVPNNSQGFILCPFGFKGEIDKDLVQKNIFPKGGLKPHCPVHGDNCPGLKKIL